MNFEDTVVHMPDPSASRTLSSTCLTPVCRPRMQDRAAPTPIPDAGQELAKESFIVKQINFAEKAASELDGSRAV